MTMSEQSSLLLTRHFALGRSGAATTSLAAVGSRTDYRNRARFAHTAPLSPTERRPR